MKRAVALQAVSTEDRCVILLVIMIVPIVVIAWGVSPAVGLIATLAALILLVVGGDAWGGSGPYGGTRPRR